MSPYKKSWYFLLRMTGLTCHYSYRKVFEAQLQIGKQVRHQHVDKLNKKQKTMVVSATHIKLAHSEKLFKKKLYDLRRAHAACSSCHFSHHF